MHVNAKDISKRINKLLIDLELSKEEIADGIKVKPASISHHINVDPKTGDFYRKKHYIREGIAKWLMVPYRKLWNEPAPYGEKANSIE